MIIGDVISNEIPSSEIQNWLLKYKEISNKYDIIVKSVSGSYIAPPEIKTEPFWVEFLQENIKTEMISPPILSLKLKMTELALETDALGLVKAYSNDFIEYIQ